MKMTITMPETRTVLFKDLERGDFFICDRELFRKIEDVFCVDNVVNATTNGQDVTDCPVFNSMRFDEYDGGGLQSFGSVTEVIPVSVEIKVSYQ